MTNAIVVGTILVEQDGIEQTNCKWYVVTNVTAKRCKIRRLESITTHDNEMMVGKSLPSDKFHSDTNEYNCILSTYENGYISFKGKYTQTCAKVWDGKNKNYSTYA